MKTREGIYGFFGEYRFLSNFHICPNLVEFDNMMFKTSEHAFVAAKTTNMTIRNQVQQIDTPSEARKFGRVLDIRPNWDDIKFGVMYQIVKSKFSRNQTLRMKLLETKSLWLEETNTWRDKTWGVCCNEGDNMLGYILMIVRSELILEDVTHGEVLTYEKN